MAFRRKDWTIHTLDIKGWNLENSSWPVSSICSFCGKTWQNHNIGCGLIFRTMTTRSPGDTSAHTAFIFSKINENIWIVLFHPQKLNFYCILFIGENMLLKTMTVTLLWLMTGLERVTFLDQYQQKIMLSNPTDFSVNRYHLNLCFYSIWFLTRAFSFTY